MIDDIAEFESKVSVMVFLSEACKGASMGDLQDVFVCEIDGVFRNITQVFSVLDYLRKSLEIRIYAIDLINQTILIYVVNLHFNGLYFSVRL